MSRPTLSLLFVFFAATGFIAESAASDWTNSGGNAGRNGLSTETGPSEAELLWSSSRPSLIAWLPEIGRAHV